MRAAVLVVIAACGGSTTATQPLAAQQAVNQPPLPPVPPEPATPTPTATQSPTVAAEPVAASPGAEAQGPPGISPPGQQPRPKRGLTAGKPTVKGGLGPEIVRRVTKRHASEIQFCYEKRLLADPNAGGLLVAKLVIATDGTVKSVTAAGIHAEVEACVIARIKSWSFPTFTGDMMVISLPYTMQPT
jgi:hypothetical protein